MFLLKYFLNNIEEVQIYLIFFLQIWFVFIHTKCVENNVKIILNVIIKYIKEILLFENKKILLRHWIWCKMMWEQYFFEKRIWRILGIVYLLENFEAGVWAVLGFETFSSYAKLNGSQDYSAEKNCNKHLRISFLETTDFVDHILSI